jgi:hypothetical protein
MPTALDNGKRPRKLLRAVIARLLGRKPWNAAAGNNYEGWHSMGDAWRPAEDGSTGPRHVAS